MSERAAPSLLLAQAEERVSQQQNQVYDLRALFHAITRLADGESEASSAILRLARLGENLSQSIADKLDVACMEAIRG